MAAPDDSGLSQQAQVAFRQLRRRFRDGLPDRWAQIEAAASPEERLQALHRLAGAAGSYGFHELSTLARAALSLAERGDRGDVSAQALDGLRSHLSALAQDTD